jgi:hypothetical protein
MDTARRHMTDGASFFFIFEVRQALKRYPVPVLHWLPGTGCRSWIFNISAATFTVGHTLATFLTLFYQYGAKRQQPSTNQIFFRIDQDIRRPMFFQICVPFEASLEQINTPG